MQEWVMTGYELLAVLLPGGALYRICARKIEGRDQTRPPIYALLTCTLVMLRGIFCYIMHWGQPQCGMIFNICICN